MRQDLVHCSGPILEIYQALPQPLSETKERANSCLVKAAERDVGVVDGLTSDHLVMCPFQVPPSRFRAFLPTEFTKARDSSSSRLKVRCFPKPKRRTCDRIGQERVSTLPESIRLIAADGSKVVTRPHLVPERRGYSFNICVAPRCETHMRFKPYTFSIFFIRFHNYGMRE